MAEGIPIRKRVEFDAGTWHALQLLGRDSMKSLQELADEAFRDLLRKHQRPSRRRCDRARAGFPPMMTRRPASGRRLGSSAQDQWPPKGTTVQSFPQVSSHHDDHLNDKRAALWMRR